MGSLDYFPEWEAEFVYDPVLTPGEGQCPDPVARALSGEARAIRCYWGWAISSIPSRTSPGSRVTVWLVPFGAWSAKSQNG